MRNLIHTIIISIALAACSANGAGSGGSLTIPDPPATSTTASAPSSSVDTTAAPSTSVPTSTPDVTATTTPSGSTPTTTGPREIVVFYINSDLEAVPVTRSVTTSEVARAAMAAIIEGPTDREAAQGLTTSMPVDAVVLGITVDDGVAMLDLSREAEAGGGSAAILTRLAQVVYTLTEFDSIDSVQILIDGSARQAFSGEGFLIDDPLTAAEFTSSVPKAGGPAQADAPTWDQSQLGSVDIGEPNARLVALVADDDTLNVRSGPGVDSAIIGRLRPGVRVLLEGDSRQIGDWDWVTVETPSGPGWVNSFYLSQFAESVHFLDCLVNDLRIRLGGDPASCDGATAGNALSDIVSTRGLWVVHHADPIRFSYDEVDGLLSSSETYRWGSNALEADSPELRARTFKEAIADRFVQSFDGNSELVFDELIEGPNGRPAFAAMPTEFEGLDFYSVFDPGDDPQYGGLDWTGWIVSFIVEGGQHKVVGLTIDEWAP